jgi:hypothetical protein
MYNYSFSLYSTTKSRNSKMYIHKNYALIIKNVTVQGLAGLKKTDGVNW